MIYWRNRLPSVKTLEKVFGERAKEALAINRERIRQNMPKAARLTRVSAWGTLEVFVIAS